MNNTEKRNPRSTHIDTMPLRDALALINEENRLVSEAIDKALPEIEAACEKMIASIAGGGRIFYIGAGTSGRLGVLDAAECPPTYGVSRDLFNGIIAGGPSCMFTAAEAQEDDPEAARRDLVQAGLKAGDVLVGISASGGAAYVVSALNYAKEHGADAIAIVNNESTKMAAVADLTIVLDTGAEVITGSTRMKAGTSQKVVLNMLSTMALVKSGCVYENMMINLRPTNIKLRRRMVGIVQEILGCDFDTAEQRLEAADWRIRAAIEN